MSFKSLSLPSFVTPRSKGTPIELFFNPILKEAGIYHVAIAYFSSVWIKDAAPGLSDFVARGGRLKWLVSPEMSEHDLKAIQEADDKEARLARVWENAEDLLRRMSYEPRKVLSWLIVDGILEVKFVVAREGSAIYHGKIGYFEDEDKEVIAFSGSYNKTGGANRNWERIDVFQSESDPERVESIVSDWSALWDGKDPTCEVFEPNEAILQSVRNSISSPRPYRVIRRTVAAPEWLKLRDYQEAAINSWFAKKGAGMFVMATGTGKTLTALSLAHRFLDRVLSKGGRLLIVIAVPYRHLLDQWVSDSELFGFDVVRCYEKRSSWIGPSSDMVSKLALQAKDTGILAVTYSTLRSNTFQSLLKKSTVPILFIGDEVHNAVEGATNMALPNVAKYRLGLTATPEKDADSSEATDKLSEYFGPPVFEYGIEKAIQGRHLVPYYYFMHLCELNEEEFGEYVALSKEISKRSASQSGTVSLPESLKKLLIKRARLIGDLSSKYATLGRILGAADSISRTLIYCSDYSESDTPPIKRVVDICAEKNIKVRKFTYVESTNDRADIIRAISSCSIDAVAAIRCLDEGVDIPSVENAFMLSSSTSIRQFVQRRGRVLRLFPGKGDANIYDFIAVPPGRKMFTKDERKAAKSLIARESERVKEFSRLALNFHDSAETIRVLDKMRSDNEHW